MQASAQQASIAEALGQALEHHRAGRLDAAAELYRRVLEAVPGQADALNLLGALEGQRGRHGEALALLQRAVAQRPEVAEFHSNLAAVWIHRGRFAEARASAERALSLDANCLDAELNRAKALGALGELEEAAAGYARLLARDPGNAAALHARGRVLERLQRPGEALDCYEAAVAAGARPLMLVDLGNAFARLARIEQACACYRSALAQRPQLAVAHYGLGIALASEGHHAEALACYERAAARKPEEARFHSARGDALKDTGRFAEAIEAYARALELEPSNFEARNHLGTVYELQGRLEEASACYEELLRRHPSDAVRFKLATLLPVVYDSAAAIQTWRRRLKQGLERLESEGVQLDPVRDMLPPSFYLAYQGGNDLAIHRSIARLCSASSQDFSKRPRAGRRDGRIRIAFVSSFFKQHTIGKLYRGLIAELSRERFHVSVVSLGSHGDDLARWIRERADHYLELPIRPAPARQRLAEEEIDLLFYPDIGMSPAAYALASSRLAPVQCVSWGHPVTTGLPTMDYFLSSRLLEPEGAEAQYSEELVKLDSLPVYYYPPTFPEPNAAEARARFGLGEDEHVYLCPQSLFKLHPDFDWALEGILRGDPAASVVLVDGLHPHWRAALCERFERDLGGLAERIRILPRMSEADFLALLATADVMLDPWHFGGGNSSYEAFAVGTPIVTLPSASLRGRVTLGCYRKMGVGEAVARDAADYVERALRLGCDRPARDALAARLREARGCLYEDRSALREVEDFFLRAHEGA